MENIAQHFSTLIAKPAPDFTAPAVMPDNTINNSFNLTSYLQGSIGVLFFYPLDFTFVCPSEIIAFDQKLAEFTKRNAKVIAVSVDSHFSHLQYRKTPLAQGGIGEIGFPMVADLAKSITESYGILHNRSVALRGTFLIDQNGMVRHMVVNDLPLGRNVDEALRMVDALLYHQAHGEVCPANWQQGDKGMVATPEGVKEYLAKL